MLTNQVTIRISRNKLERLTFMQNLWNNYKLIQPSNILLHLIKNSLTLQCEVGISSFSHYSILVNCHFTILKGKIRSQNHFLLNVIDFVSGMSPLMHAVKTNSLEIVRAILDGELVDVHLKDAHDRDVIHHVVAIGTSGDDLKPVATFDNLKMLDLVLQYGARPSISALNLARESGAVKIAEKLSKLLNVELVCTYFEMLNSGKFPYYLGKFRKLKNLMFF